MMTQTPQEKADVLTAKYNHKDFVKKNPDKAQENQSATLTQILESPTPSWGNLLIKLQKFN